MLALVILAVPLEHTYGPLRIFAIFLSAGVLQLCYVYDMQCFLQAAAAIFVRHRSRHDSCQDFQRSWRSLCIPLFALNLRLEPPLCFWWCQQVSTRCLLHHSKLHPSLPILPLCRFWRHLLEHGF
jgi:hypothetical protein